MTISFREPSLSTSGLSLKAVREYAERVVEHYDLNLSDKPDIEGLVHSLGGKIKIDHIPETLLIFYKNRFFVNVRQMSSSRRDRFTVAHDLGHYFLHYLYPESIDDKEGKIFDHQGPNRDELEANVFAASLLMPKKMFIKNWYEHQGNVLKVSSQLDVSPAACRVRAEVLGLL